MKKFLTFVAMALLLVGCAKEYNDSAIREAINDLQIRVTALESNIDAIQSAIGEGVFVAKVQEYVDPDTGRTIGVTVTYTNGEVKHFKISPEEGYAGPVLSVITNGAGDLVWAVDGVAIKIDGEEVPVYQTPTFSIDEEGNLWVSIDGSDPVNLGPVTDGGATLEDGIFTDIKVLQDKIVLTLSDGTTVNIPFAEAFKLVIANEEYAYNGLEKIEIPYTVSAKTENTVVNVIGYDPKDFTVEVTAEKIVIEPLRDGVSAVMMAYADSQIGLTSVVKLVVEPKGVVKVDQPWNAEADYVLDGEGGTITARVVSNIDFTVVPQETWIHHVSTKGQLHVITLSVDENTTTEEREGDVFIKDAEGFIVQSITILQGPGAPADGPAILSKKESANSYLVYAPGEYKFAAVKGNTTESVGAVAKAELLWETDNTTTAPAANSIIASVGYADGYITFATPETLVPGNALIAAKDANDVILWSWHIWIPASEIVNGTFNAMAVPMMDRNLGALVPAVANAEPDGKSIGLFYQWGRKDPFPGTASVSASTPIATNGTISLESEKQNYTPEESVQIPTVYIKTGGDSNKTWMVGTEAVNLTLWGAEKTVYDPCPPGYVVAPCDTENSPMWKGEGFTVDTANKIFKAGDAVFPIAGYLDQGEYVKYGQRTYVWSATATSKDNNIATLILVDGSSASVTVQRMSRGGNVRCVVANAAAIVPPTPGTGGGDQPGGGDEPGDATVDLSKAGSANSYIVNKAGDYKFKAVKGNSTDAVAAAKAEILWEINNTETAPEVNSIIAKVAVADGYITFSTPATLVPGNALIAAKDANDVILWSWHIWIPATEIAVKDGAALCGANIMDRNLGALTAMPKTGDPDPLAIGLCFQWGRKDPFPGIVSFTSNTGAGVAGTAWTAKGEHITTAYSIAHPTEYAHVPEVDEGVWNVDDPKDLWNDANDQKTIYDPCPAGYRVPLYDSSLPMWKGSFGDDWVLDGDNFRFSYGDIVFPIGGYIDCWTPGYEKTGARTHVWASKWYDAERSNCMYYRGDKENKYYSQKFHKAKAGSVRCVAE